ncbi:MAG: site-specific integrase [bacterium]
MSNGIGLFKRCKCQTGKPCHHPWWIRYSHNGKQRKESTGTTNKKLAKEILDKIKGEIVRDEFSLPQTRRREEISFEMLAERYIEDYSKLHKKSWPRDLDVVKALSCIFSGRVITEITPHDIEEYKRKRLQGEIKLVSRFQKKKPARATVNREVQMLGAMFNKADILFKQEDFNIPRDNPVKRVSMYKVNNQRNDFLQKDEIEAMLDACDENTLRPILLCAVTTGMRKDEILKLRWGQVDFNNDKINYIAKGGKRAVAELTHVFKAELLRMKTRANGSQAVFISKKGTRRKDVRKAFNRALEDSGVAEARRQAEKPNFRFHDLRHTFASHLAMSSGSLVSVQKALGHTDPRTTQRYAHLAENYQKERIGEMVDKLFGKKKHISSTSSTKSTRKGGDKKQGGNREE